MCVYIYIYIYISLSLSIYIYIYRGRRCTRRRPTRSCRPSWRRRNREHHWSVRFLLLLIIMYVCVYIYIYIYTYIYIYICIQVRFGSFRFVSLRRTPKEPVRTPGRNRFGSVRFGSGLFGNSSVRFGSASGSGLSLSSNSRQVERFEASVSQQAVPCPPLKVLLVFSFLFIS